MNPENDDIWWSDEDVINMDNMDTYYEHLDAIETADRDNVRGINTRLWAITRLMTRGNNYDRILNSDIVRNANPDSKNRIIIEQCLNDPELGGETAFLIDRAYYAINPIPPNVEEGFRRQGGRKHKRNTRRKTRRIKKRVKGKKRIKSSRRRLRFV